MVLPGGPEAPWTPTPPVQALDADTVLTMTHSIPWSIRNTLAGVLYRTLPAAVVRRLKQTVGPPEHETAAFWNGELSGRMSTPSINGRVGLALRNAAIAELIRHCGPIPSTVMDVGCGFCDLAGVLVPLGMKSYVGVDLSDYVIEWAGRERAPTIAADVTLHTADLREFSPAPDLPPFDVIVFNEVLKYVEIDEAIAQIDRYRRWLSPDGVICVMHNVFPKGNAVFRAMHGHFTWIYGTVLQQYPERPGFRLRRHPATPPFLLGLIR